MITCLILTFLLGFLVAIPISLKKDKREELFAENATLRKFYDYDISIDDVDYSNFSCK